MNVMTTENQNQSRLYNILEEIFIGWNHSNGLKNKPMGSWFPVFHFPYLFEL